MNSITLGKQLMLIDDNPIDHFIVTIICEKLNLSKPIQKFSEAEKALNFLKIVAPGDLPEFILLDINMPHMNGFQFLEQFIQLPAEISRRCKIVILSSSLTPSEIDHIKQHPAVVLHLEKPLLAHKLQHLLIYH